MDPVEKELLLSGSPEGVLRLYGSSDIDVGDISEDVERTLLEKKERLIDLALAQRSQNQAIISELFLRGIENNDETLRLACLKNKYRPLIGKKYPYFLFQKLDDGKLRLEEEKFSDYFGRVVTNSEIDAVFAGLPDQEFIFSFLEFGTIWNYFGPNRWIACMRILNHIEDLGLRSSSRAFSGIESILCEVPVSEEWITALSCAQNSLHPRFFKSIDFVVDRWIDSYGMNKEVSDSYSFEQLGEFLFRCKFAALADSEVKRYLRDPAVWVRNAAYASFRAFSKSDIRDMYKRDGDKCLHALQKNESFWRIASNREELGELSDGELFKWAMMAQPGYDNSWSANKADGWERKKEIYWVIGFVLLFIWIFFF